MKTIGLLGGMSWESTTSYYKAINERVKAQLGGLHSAKICLYSVDFAEIEQLQHAGDWPATARILAQAAKSVEQGGADFLMICTNTMHKVFHEIESQISIPILHIADATAQQLVRDKVTTVGLLGTRFTMEQDFYKGRLAENFGIEVITPEPEEQTLVHDVIYQELCQGLIKSESKTRYLQIIECLHQRGAQAVILGCTEIALLVQQSDTPVQLYDTTEIHAARGVELALSKG
ncbi:aspartate/glutamate racemase family protein [Microbulbifer sp. CAU 1566]|uniref:aspartate/glutamate racemase family protein n=1 Tax=Microbulbifer sp. CAU 1566 TaxID=2933269 RepID=UPI0020068C40|nr:aspartate/glutamate racemase family protein [Microbulbifer sp. CAU 1566]MCK7596484.1 aspartate/glutamate racemase family protein [Microbulbifer sp. CAU 1566]